MSVLRIPSLRHLPRLPTRLIPTQRRWAQVHDVRFLATTRPRQAILDKYQSKLEERARAEGLSSVEELKVAYADKIAEKRRESEIKIPIPQAPETPVKQPNKGPLPTPPESPAKGYPEGTIPQAPETPVRQPNAGEKPAVKTLGEILNMDKVKDLPDNELSAIWRLRHANSPTSLCAVIPAGTYTAMEELAKTSPQFVLPVPHENQGAEIHFLQWTFDKDSQTSTVLFTQLAEYKARGEFAQPHTTVTHHLDLVADRDLVLMQGQVVDGRGVTVDQARWLVMCLQKFYGGWEVEGEVTGERRERAEERQRLLQWFSVGDERFSVDKLLEEAEKMG